MKTRLSRSTWATIILFGFIGQIAWSVENMEFNVFLFNEIGGSTHDIADMVAWSAIISTITTLIMGILSDKAGHRKRFLCWGYVIWGLMTIAFAAISREHTAALWPSLSAAEVLSRTVFFVILLDCIMSFFGSVANDASFNAWVTESTDETNRASVEGVLNVFPMLAMLVVAGGSGILTETIGWPGFFLAVGGVVTLCGLLGLKFVKDSKTVSSKESLSFLESVCYGFRPSVIRKNPKFYLTLAAMCIFNISAQVFMPYLLIYLQYTLGFDTITYSMVMAIVIILASVMSVLIGKITDQKGKDKVFRTAIFLYAGGLLLASLMREPVLFVIAGTIMMTGYAAVSVVFMSAVRDYTPIDHVGMFQGIRLLAYVLLPMLIGPYIGTFLIDHSDAGTYINSYGELVSLPVPALFVASALISLLILIPAKKLFVQKSSS